MFLYYPQDVTADMGPTYVVPGTHLYNTPSDMMQNYGNIRGQVPLIHEVLDALRIPALAKEGIEADDILATLSSSAEAAGMDVLICSGDRDSFQLVT